MTHECYEFIRVGARLPMPVREAYPAIYICYYSGKAASFGVRLMAGRPNTVLQ